MLKLHGYERPSAYELLNDEFIQNNDNNTTTTTTNYNTNNNNYRSKSTFDINKRYQNNTKDFNSQRNNNTQDIINYKSNPETDIKVIKQIRDRIYTYSIELDEISRYFDHLLSYNICRKENVFFPDEFERLMQLEKYDFTMSEIYSAFNYLDTKKDGVLDRLEFIQILKNVPHPISTILNYIKNNRLAIDDIAYKMGYDI